MAQTLGGDASTGDNGATGANTPTASSATASASDSASASGTTASADSTSAGTSAGSDAADESTDDDGPGTTTAPAVSWNRYTLDVRSGGWSTTPLDELWQGANAPPATDIAAAMSLTHFDRLWVVTADGTFYEQADGVWQAPGPLWARFPMTQGLDVGAMTHTPSIDGSGEEGVFFVDNPIAIIYTQHENGGVDLVKSAMLTDEPGGAPQGSGRTHWYLPIVDPDNAMGNPDWLQWYASYDDGNLWRFNNAFEWTNAPIDDNEFFDGGPGQPDPTTIEAAYYDDTFERAHFIGP